MVSVVSHIGEHIFKLRTGVAVCYPQLPCSWHSVNNFRWSVE